MAKPTATVKALVIIQQHNISAPRQFGRFLWPDNPNWSALGNVGRGVTTGVGLQLAAGGFLGKLQKRGLIRFSFSENVYKLTDEGKAHLKAVSDNQN